MTANELRDIRERLRINHHGAAELCGVSRASFRRFEQGAPVPRYVATIMRLCDQFAGVRRALRLADIRERFPLGLGPGAPKGNRNAARKEGERAREGERAA